MKKSSVGHYRYAIIGVCIILIIISTILGGCGAKTNEEEINEPPIIAEEEKINPIITEEGEEEEAPAEPTEEPEVTEELKKTEKAENAVTVTRMIYGTEIEITANPIQVKDGMAALELEYKLIGEVNPVVAGDDIGLPFVLASGPAGLGAYNIRLVDFANKRVYQELRAARDPHLFSTGEFTEVEGDYKGLPNTFLREKNPLAKSVTLYQAPESEKVTVFVPNLGLIANVPVEEASGDLASYIEIAGEPDIASMEKQSGAFVEYLQDYGEEIAIKKEGIDVTITISSDVLFETDKYELNPEANVAINKAIENIKASYDGGTVKVVGHTDDVDTEEYNQTLSEKRAEAVATVMKQELGEAFTLETLGKGETEPLTEGTSTEERAINRRVDIVFEGKTQEDTLVETKADAGIPTTEKPTVVGAGEWVEFSDEHDDPTTYKARAVKVIRAEGALVGYFELLYKLDEEGRTTDYAFYDREFRSKRNFDEIFQYKGAHALSLLTSKGRMFPYDYGVIRWKLLGEEYVRQRLLGDDFRYNLFAKGEGETPPILVTVVWPDTGQDRVTVDVESRFRIEDIEVENDAEAVNGEY